MHWDVICVRYPTDALNVGAMRVVLTVYPTLYGVSDELTGSDDDGEQPQQDDCPQVIDTVDPVIIASSGQTVEIDNTADCTQPVKLKRINSLYCGLSIFTAYEAIHDARGDKQRQIQMNPGVITCRYVDMAIRFFNVSGVKR